MIRRPIASDTSSRFIIVLGLVLFGAALAAAQAPRDQSGTARTGTGVIRGRVVRADTGEPLRRVQVHLDEWGTGDHSGPASTMTDAEGRNELRQVPTARDLLKATRS